jgi:hypothetical protein
VYRHISQQAFLNEKILNLISQYFSSGELTRQSIYRLTSIYRKPEILHHPEYAAVDGLPLGYRFFFFFFFFFFFYYYYYFFFFFALLSGSLHTKSYPWMVVESEALSLSLSSKKLKN